MGIDNNQVRHSMLKSKRDAIVWSLIFPLLSGCATQKVDILDGKNFRVIEVNGYKLPSTNTDIKAQFKNGKMFLIGTCNPTSGNYVLNGRFITLSDIGHLGQNACTELFETSSGKISERIADGPNVRTEDEFIKIGEIKFRYVEVGNQLHFIHQDSHKSVVLER